MKCDHLVGTYYTDHVGNGWFNQSDIDSGGKLDYEKSYMGFEFFPFKFCPKCGVNLQNKHGDI